MKTQIKWSPKDLLINFIETASLDGTAEPISVADYLSHDVEKNEYKISLDPNCWSIVGFKKAKEICDSKVHIKECVERSNMVFFMQECDCYKYN